MKFKDKDTEGKFLIKVIEAKEELSRQYRLGIHKAPASWDELNDKYKIVCKEFNITEKENAEYQKGMIADAKIIKEADNKIIKLEKENALYKEQYAKLIDDFNNLNLIHHETVTKLVARNGRIMDLEYEISNIKYLDRVLVADIFIACLDDKIETEEAIDKIMELAIKPIDKDSE